MERFSENRGEKWSLELVAQTPLQRSQHGVHWGARKTVIETLIGSYYPDHKAKGHRHNACAAEVAFRVDDENRKVTPCPSLCHDRGCQLCGKIKSAQAAARLVAYVEQAKHPKFISLTYRSVDLPLDRQYDLLHKYATKLLRSKLWRDSITGGYWFIQLTRNPKTGLWHLHLHLLVDGKYLYWKALRRLWEKITHGSYEVDIRAVDDREHIINEITHYVTTPADIAKWPPEKILEWFTATKHKRLMNPIGDQLGKHAEEEDEEEPKKTDRPDVGLSRLVHLARHKHERPLAALVLIAVRWSGFQRFIYDQVSDLPEAPRVAVEYMRLRCVLRIRPPPLKKDPVANKVYMQAREAFIRTKAELDELIYVHVAEILERDTAGFYFEGTWSEFYSDQAA